jgi:Xaa-Pro aminopeptidase
LAFVVLPLAGEPVFIVCGIEENLVRAESRIKDIRPYIEFKENPIDFLVDVVKEKNLEKGKIAVELKYFPIQYFDEFSSKLPEMQLTDCTEIMQKLRMIKSNEEIELLAFAAKATRKSIEAAFLSTREGDSERDLANKIRSNLFALGLDELTFFSMGVGERGQMAHPSPGDYVLKSGETVRLDLGALNRGYNSDVARTACIGHPNGEQKKIYKSVMEVHREIIENMNIGVRFCDLFQLCKKGFESRNLNLPLPHIGHGLGIDLHENPMISPVNENVLQENMALCIEPFYITPEGRGYHVEDLILIGKEGPEILTGSSLDDELPIIG